LNDKRSSSRYGKDPRVHFFEGWKRISDVSLLRARDIFMENDSNLIRLARLVAKGGIEGLMSDLNTNNMVSLPHTSTESAILKKRWVRGESYTELISEIKFPLCIFETYPKFYSKTQYSFFLDL